MKKVFILPTVLFCVIMISFSVYYKRTEKVLVVGKLIGFEIEEAVENIENGEFIQTSLNKLGIITYINPKTNQFAALGHSLINNEKGKEIQGRCYDVKLEENSNNSFSAYLDKDNPIGQVYYDNYSGVYGKIDEINQKQYKQVETINRYHIKKGKANILISLDGENLESYEIKITGINYIDSNKNIRIRIIDEKLINKTGGITKGMSGTPVMQDGKLIGAINCVNASNPKDGFAIFIDKLI